MSQNIEIEFKNMLTKQEYGDLFKKFSLNKNDIFSQENYYFDTHDFALKKKGCALRIRNKQNTYEMTLKQPADVGLLETNQLLTVEEAKLAIDNQKLPKGTITKLLEDNGISYSQIQYFGSLVTNRAETIFEQGLLVLDHSIYLNHEDYELEYEVHDFQRGQKDFLALLQSCGIPERKTANKIQRFYNQKLRITNK
ncbi:CYTH domain-containing protein [Neobacillus sp. Marseille-QA0830]